MLIGELKPEIIWETSCCAQWRSAVAKINGDIGEKLPQLASKIDGAVYESVQKAIRLKKGSMTVYVYPRQIYAPYIKTEQEGKELVDWAREMVNNAESRIEKEARR